MYIVLIGTELEIEIHKYSQHFCDWPCIDEGAMQN